ncbi:MAG: DUF6265 family protein [Phycisphaerales bacterium]
MLTLASGLVVCGAALAAQQQTASPPPLDAVAFLAGTWRGDMDKDFAEEIWSTPRGSNMTGCFRWLGADGNPVVFEMLSINRESDAVRLRLRHFSPTLVAKEDADKPITLKLAESAQDKAVFRAEQFARDVSTISYARNDTSLHVVVEFAHADPPREALRFTLKRAE